MDIILTYCFIFVQAINASQDSEQMEHWKTLSKDELLNELQCFHARQLSDRSIIKNTREEQREQEDHMFELK